MTTTIQVSEKLMGVLKTKKMYDKESYEEIIWDLVEDTLELSKETKKAIELAKQQFAKGKFYTHEQVKKELKL
ncbi:hypothetical protein HZB88_03580 [archaeon]|nr:hypothetical protein [archaeon]